MKLVLVNIYPSNTIARYLLSCYILKAYLDSHFVGNCQLSVQVLNFSNSADTLKISEKIIRHNPDAIGYSCYIWNIEKVLDLSRNLKERDRFIHILGGPEISQEKVALLPDAGNDEYLVIGEGEKTLLNLVLYLVEKKKGGNHKVPAGVIECGNVGSEYIPNMDRLVDLDDIPSIYLNGVIDETLYSRQQAFLETTRGCPYRCKYCVYHKNLPSGSFYSIKRVCDEMEYLIVEKKIVALRILDSVFTHDISRAKRIVEHLIDLKTRDDVRLPWIYWEYTYNKVDSEFIQMTALLKYKDGILNTNQTKPLNRSQIYSDILKDYSVINCVGVQSFCKEALRAVGRPIIEQSAFKCFFDSVNKNNIALKVDMILGLPFETYDSYFQGLEYFLPFFKDTDHILNIHRLQMLPGSDLEKISDRCGINYSLQAPHTVFSTNTFPEEALNYATKLTGLLFRIVNSPLRGMFFKAKEDSGLSYLNFLEKIYDQAAKDDELRNSELICQEFIDDDYWNDRSFRDIPSEWLIKNLLNE